MLSFRPGGSFVLALFLGAACGGSSFSSAPGDGGGGGVGDDGTVGVGGGGGDATADGLPLGDGGAGKGSTDGSASDGSSGVRDAGEAGPDGIAVTPADATASDGPASPCPDVRGTYTVTVAPGSTGCGSLNTAAPECIRQTSCNLELRSNVSGGGPVAIAGTAQLRNDGVFDSASLTEGTAMRSGCTGTWNAATSTLTVDCGGQGTTQSCVVSLVRTGPVGLVCN
jgi:hypothetical protein